MAVTSTISGSATVGGTMSESGTASNGETLTGWQWQSAEMQNGTFTDIAGATSQQYTIEASIRCRWLRCYVTYDDGGSPLYAASNQVKVGPCGGGGKARTKVVRSPQQEEPTPSVFPQVVKRPRNVVRVDLSKWRNYGPTNR